jgi:hypothetical protein
VSQSSAPTLKSRENVRGARYCEVLVVRGNFFGFTATVYNTLGCNACPSDAWRKLAAEKIKKEWKARAVIMNGPRYFLMDKIGQYIEEPPPSVFFDGLEMKERATLPISFSTFLKGKPVPYQERMIQRSTEFVFNKGSEVYQIESHLHTYIMQSYSQIIDPNLSEADLHGLQSRLKLPKGWLYTSSRLEDDLVLKTLETQQAFVIQDDLGNTYQRITLHRLES